MHVRRRSTASLAHLRLRDIEYQLSNMQRSRRFPVPAKHPVLCGLTADLPKIQSANQSTSKAESIPSPPRVHAKANHPCSMPKRKFSHAYATRTRRIKNPAEIRTDSLANTACPKTCWAQTDSISSWHLCIPPDTRNAETPCFAPPTQ